MLGFPDRALVTTQRKSLAISALQEYWRVKGIFMQIRVSPSLLDDNRLVLQILQFLENHTQLPEMNLWKRLNYQQKLLICKYFSIIEENVGKLSITSTSPSPEVYVVLSGSAYSTDLFDEGEYGYSHGEVFGNIGLFDYSWEDGFDISSVMKSSPPFPDRVFSVNVERCTLLKLRLNDYYNQLVLPGRRPLSPVKVVEEPKDTVSVVTDSVSDDDLCARIRRLADRVLSIPMFDLLSSQNILPEDPSSPSFSYISIGHVGRDLLLDRSFCAFAFIILEGEIRLSLEKSSNSVPSSLSSSLPSTSRSPISPTPSKTKIICRRKGEKSLVIEKNKVPLLLIQAGNMFSLTISCFEVGMEPEKIVSSPRRAKSPPKKPRLHSKFKKGVMEKDAYRIRLQFEKRTTYLLVPEDVIKTALKESTWDISGNVTTIMEQMNESILNRIKSFEDWIHGEVHWNTKVVSEKNPKKVRAPVVFPKL